MKTLEVSDEQYAQLDAVREALAEDVTYGHVRPRDAVQYLLDAHDGDDLDVEISPAATDADAADPETADGADDDSTDDDGADDTAATDDANGDAEPSETDDDTEDPGGTPTPTPTPGGGDDKMSAMMNLLDTHDEKWERADSQETRYVVDLPDGTTEEAQTKDDVKAILFKNY